MRRGALAGEVRALAGRLGWPVARLRAELLRAGLRALGRGLAERQLRALDAQRVRTKGRRR